MNLPVFIGSSAGILAITLWAFLDRTGAETAITAAVTWVSKNLGWFYTLVVTGVLAFVVAVGLSRIGNVRLGPDHSRPQFGLFSWTAMLFAAGIGIDLMFFSVAEPVTQYMTPPHGQGQTVESARQALAYTLFHYGITGWGLYALMGMALAYFSYRHNLPLSIRSALHPIFGKRIDGAVGNGVDIAAMLGAIFGLATSLGIGVAQLDVGISRMIGIPSGMPIQIGLVVISVVMAIVSALSGVEKGVRRLSQLNIILAIGMMLYVLVAGRTSYLLDGIVQNAGDILSRFPGMTMDSMAYDRPDDWLQSWTIFFWAWWIAWAPFVGLFLARISRGRTIRQFVIGTLTVPFAFILLWISIFGNSALDVVRHGDKAFADQVVNTPEQGFYSLLEQYPGAPLLVAVATFTGLLFYVTSADSGALVMANFTSKLSDPEEDGPKWVRLFWAVATGLLTVAMLMVGGITTLQNATVIMGVPFAVILVFIMMGLLKALRIEAQWADSARAALPALISGTRAVPGDRERTWRQRLARTVRFHDARAAERFQETTTAPALNEVAAELRDQGVDAQVSQEFVEAFGIHAYHLDVPFEGERDFRYQVYPVQCRMPAYGTGRSSQEHYYRMEVFTGHGSLGTDVLGFTRDQLIGSVLDLYERHLEFLHRAQAPGLETLTVATGARTQWIDDYDTNPEEKA
ncbi:choline BCCT transporter BetT [Arthrobacter sp. UM1]|uniref:choline BCCT transporter BetT n=1 Tax=Arthrobacter sp. UM1 TaxID=2766776 RepID=UPI001CF7161C|nr:choline BCCT transporter BetT [Arthrobacter sp. UM1]